jgi:hypothetical protein
MKRAIVAIALIAAAAPTHAAVIYDNGVAAEDVNGGSASGGANSTHDDFVLSPGQSMVGDVHWFGDYGGFGDPDIPDDFRLEIYPDSGGEPDLAVPIWTLNAGAVERRDTGFNLAGTGGDIDIYEYWRDVEPVPLDPGVFYWISIGNLGNLDWNWSRYWDGTESTPEYFFLNGSFIRGSVAFSLTSVPEPSILTLLGIGLVSVAFAHNKRRSSGKADR